MLGRVFPDTKYTPFGLASGLPHFGQLTRALGRKSVASKAPKPPPAAPITAPPRKAANMDPLFGFITTFARTTMPPNTSPMSRTHFCRSAGLKRHLGDSVGRAEVGLCAGLAVASGCRGS